MPRWYYQRGEMRQTPSILQGMEPQLEARHRREGARFIMELGTSMNLSLSTTMATAVAFFHRFYMCHSFQDFPRYAVGCACLFLAGKVEETPKKCRDMIESARKQLDESSFIEQFGSEDKNRTEELMTLERILLQTIKFDLQLEHPYKYLLKYANCLKGEKTRLEKMVQMAWNFINDSLCTTLCLQWEPEIVAIALMHLACKLSKFEVNDWSGRTSEHLRWWDMFVQDMTIDVLEDICHQVLDFYSQTQDSTPTNSSEAPNSIPPNHSPTPTSPSTVQLPEPPSNPTVHPASVYQPSGLYGFPPQIGATATPPNSVYPNPGTNYSSNTHVSSPLTIGGFGMAGVPPPFFTHQPPPPIMSAQPPQPLPPLPQQPPPPPADTDFQPPLPI